MNKMNKTANISDNNDYSSNSIVRISENLKPSTSSISEKEKTSKISSDKEKSSKVTNSDKEKNSKITSSDNKAGSSSLSPFTKADKDLYKGTSADNLPNLDEKDEKSEKDKNEENQISDREINKNSNLDTFVKQSKITNNNTTKDTKNIKEKDNCEVNNFPVQKITLTKNKIEDVGKRENGEKSL